MSKQLLSEGVIRRFMKLADIKPLTHTFLEAAEPDFKADKPIGPGSEDTPQPDMDPGALDLDMPPAAADIPPAHRDEEEFGAGEENDLEIPPDVADTVANLIASALNDALPGVNLNVETEEEEGDLGDMSFEEPEELDEKHRKDARDRGGKGSGRDSGGRRVTPLEEAIRDAVVGALQEGPKDIWTDESGVFAPQTRPPSPPGGATAISSGDPALDVTGEPRPRTMLNPWTDPELEGTGMRLRDREYEFEPSFSAEEHGYSKPDLRPGDRYSDYDAATQMADPGWGGPGGSKPPLSGYSEYPIPALSPSWEEARLASRRRAMEEAVENVEYVDDEKLVENIYRKIMAKLTQKRK